MSIFIFIFVIQTVIALLRFPKYNGTISNREYDILNNINLEDWKHFVDLGVESSKKELRLEETLRSSDIKIQNGSLSHIQLLETLRNDQSNEDSELAKIILKSSLFIYNSQCIENGISAKSCRNFLVEKSIPQETVLWRKCSTILSGSRDGHHAYRRLLPSNYQDGFYEMYSGDKLPSARYLSTNVFHGQSNNVQQGNRAKDINGKNLALVQWAQFIEHDLSKPVATSMKNGHSIECCNQEQFKLQPRYLHPACSPLVGQDREKSGRETCLNYVRSALALGSNCNFGAAEQLNQASGYLDLSQLYGHTHQAQQRMRSHRFGQIKCTKSLDLIDDMLPVAENPQAFCVQKYNTTEICFMAGDSRVNSNPFSIVLYTLFMRSHNQIANYLRKFDTGWNDDYLYEAAKAINIQIYRRVVLKEWLPAVLGKKIADNINAESNEKVYDDASQLLISNEFAVAASRFYLSMMPNELQSVSTLHGGESKFNTPIHISNITNSPNIFVLKDEIYKSNSVPDSKELNKILVSILNQRAMKMDPEYAESLVHTYLDTHPSRSDILAFDIQRGRDHGLQSYVQYLQLCQGITIRSWDDLQGYMSQYNIIKLKSVYTRWEDIDLIVGGISENPVNGSTVGPTFTCILSEQFFKLIQWHQKLDNQAHVEDSYFNVYQNWTGAQLLCANTKLTRMPSNIFRVTSQENPFLPCSMFFNFAAP